MYDHAKLTLHENPHGEHDPNRRYQRASEPIDERWVGANPPGHALAGKRGRIC